MRGRIKICSRGVLFDPEDGELPVERYSFKAMRAECCPPQPFARERDASSPGLGSEMFVLEVGSVTQMREDGAHHPYRLVTPAPAAPEAAVNATAKATAKAAAAAPSFVFIFALLHTQLDKVMPLVRHLWSVSQQVHGGGGGGGGEGAGGDRGGAGAHVMADVSERAKCTVATMKLRLAAPAVVPSHFVRSAKQVAEVPVLRKNGSVLLGNSNTESPGATADPDGSTPPTVGPRPIPSSRMPKLTSTPCSSYMRNTGPASSHALSLVRPTWRQ